MIYEESDLIIRTIRDIYSDDIDQILIDEPESFEKARDFFEDGHAARRRSFEAVRRSAYRCSTSTSWNRRSSKSTNVRCNFVKADRS